MARRAVALQRHQCVHTFRNNIGAELTITHPHATTEQDLRFGSRTS